VTEPAPRFLRLTHLALFLSLCAGGLYATWPEVDELIATLAGPRFRAGDPPNLFAVGSFFALGLCALGLAWRAAKGRVPIWLSASVLVVFSFAFYASRTPPEGRSIFDADRRILEAAEALHTQMNEQLQREGEVTDDPAAWNRPLEAFGLGPVRHAFTRLPLTAQLVGSDEVPPVQPGKMYVQITSDRASYTIRPVGFDRRGAPAFLTDDEGRSLAFKGLFNPNRR
jgi:hypothetical protein